MHALVYTCTKGDLVIEPYYQYSDVPTNPKIGIVKGAWTQDGALMVNHNLKQGVSLAVRGEYLKSSGNASEQAVNLIFGPGSGGWTFTLTPTYQDHGFFIRGDFSVVQATNFTPGDGFAPLGLNRT